MFYNDYFSQLRVVVATKKKTKKKSKIKRFNKIAVKGKQNQKPTKKSLRN